MQCGQIPPGKPISESPWLYMLKLNPQKQGTLECLQSCSPPTPSAETFLPLFGDSLELVEAQSIGSRCQG